LKTRNSCRQCSESAAATFYRPTFICNACLRL